MDLLRVKKVNFYYFLVLIIIVYIAFLVGNRDPYIDKDYNVYYDAFVRNESKEVTFNIITKFCKELSLGVNFLFFIYCFLGLSIKFKLFINEIGQKSILSFILFIILYLFCFFPIWDVTQIRISVAVGLFFLGVYAKQTKFKWGLILASILFHSSFIVILGFYLLTRVFKWNKIFAVTLFFIFSNLSIYILAMSDYDVYSVSNWGETYKILSLKNIYILFTNFLIFFYLRERVDYTECKQLNFISFSLLFFCCYLGLFYPSIAIRFSDILLFTTLFSLFTIQGISILRVYKVVTAIILAPYFTYIYFFSMDKIFNLHDFLGIFL